MKSSSLSKLSSCTAGGGGQTDLKPVPSSSAAAHESQIKRGFARTNRNCKQDVCQRRAGGHQERARAWLICIGP